MVHNSVSLFSYPFQRSALCLWPIIAFRLLICAVLSIWSHCYSVSSFSGEALNRLGPVGEGNMPFCPNNGRIYLTRMEDSVMVESSFWRKLGVEYVVKFYHTLRTFILFYQIKIVYFQWHLLLLLESLLISLMQGVDPSIRAEVWPYLLGV